MRPIVLMGGPLTEQCPGGACIAQTVRCVERNPADPDAETAMGIGAYERSVVRG